MNIGNLNNTVTTIGEIPEGECFVCENQLYIKTARSGGTYEDLISSLVDDETEITPSHLSTHCLCVNLADGVIDEFSPNHPCKRVLTKVSIVPE